ncbi:diguanylate cyclase [Aliivibrio sp. S3MY1]|uniref:diguanylate cyclase domain-containing protein n=1 Tax=unclassified Aliivibrio TaxID=2645654 RepID=UPI002378AFAD|nr:MULTISPECIES: diguanylate cyclase [unclassified Aliivibrio]MDD9197210.1 diguanylate cyclase [Aliivibrio sp. S3MY1]MDD9200052.1 diguanylate cyclase [Aliivibrio sp. S2MY1]
MALISLCVCYVFIGIVIFNVSNESARTINKNNMVHLLGKYESEVLIKINEYLTLSKVFKYLIFTKNSFITEDEFNLISGNLIHNNKAIKSLQLAPNGFVKFAYPKKGNENVYIDLFTDKKRKQDAFYARDNKVSMMSEPLVLFQGGLGLIMRTPVFVGNEFKDFWGFSIVVLNIESFIKTLSLNELSADGYNYKLSFIEKSTNKVKMISETSNKVLSHTVEHKFSVLNQCWVLSVSSKDNWLNPIEYKYKVYILVFFIVSSFVISYMFMSLLEKKKEMYKLSYVDSLTGLYNRRSFDEKFSSLFKTSILFFSDLDGFKKVNDIYGHEVGDRLLVEISRRIKFIVGKRGYVFRLGGDEFSIVLRNTLKLELDSFKMEIINTISEPITIDDVSLNIGISIGHSLYPDDGVDKENLIRVADKRMYKIKFNNSK